MYLASPYTVAASAVAGYIVKYEPSGKEAAPSGVTLEKQGRK
jgi:aconitase A